MDVEAYDEGYLAKILTGPGETAEVGSVVAIIAENEAEIQDVAAGGGGAAAAPVEATIPATTGPSVGVSIDMPALSSTMKEGKIVEWVKNVGDKVEAGDVLLVVESDKVRGTTRKTIT
jgi:pyruvate dehydrogenase E2 component (dihydrolipoamide acetyltransferase)